MILYYYLYIYKYSIKNITIEGYKYIKDYFDYCFPYQ